MAAAVRTQIEDSVVARIAPLKMRGVIASVKPFNGVIDTDEDIADIKRILNGQYPGVLVRCKGASYHEVQVQRRRVVKDQSIEIFVVSASQRSREENVRNKVYGGGAGAAMVIETLLGLLLGFQVEADGAGRMIPRDEDEVLQLPDLSIWRSLWSVPVDARPAPVTESEYTLIHSELNLSSDEDDAANPVVVAETDVSA